jgi:hypothetical protein
MRLWLESSTSKMELDFTKRAGLDKEKGFSKLVMLCGREFMYRMLYLKRDARELAYYYFMSCFESANICGESGVHMNIMDMEIAKTPGHNDMWAISVTLNMTLEDYRKKRRAAKFGNRRPKVVQETMPGFKEIKP